MFPASGYLTYTLCFQNFYVSLEEFGEKGKEVSILHKLFVEQKTVLQKVRRTQ